MQCLEHFHSLLFVGGKKERWIQGGEEENENGRMENEKGREVGRQVEVGGRKEVERKRGEGRKEKRKEFMSDNLTLLVNSRRCNIQNIRKEMYFEVHAI